MPIYSHCYIFVSKRHIKYMAGHRYVSSTEGYQVNQIEDLQADIDQYHPLG
ncbi:MAG: hypothetical protein ACXVJP_19860 [Mucilaginibacter sp.]